MQIKVEMEQSVGSHGAEKEVVGGTECTNSEDWREEVLSICSATSSEVDSERATTSSGFSEDGLAETPKKNGLADKLKEQLAKLDELLIVVEKVSALVKAIFEANEKQRALKEGISADDSSLESGISVSSKNEKLFIGCLSPHQIDGVRWIKVLDDHELSGILADDMGMGKTVQVIAFISELMEQNISGPFLIVTPLSVLNNWESEFERFAPRIPIVKFAGSKDQRMLLYPKLRQKKVVLGTTVTPVILTTYDIALREKILMNFNWRFIIVDEGHRLKNAKSKLYRTLKYHTSRSRLLLTGTPLQNDLTELWTLLRFVLPKIFPEENLLEDYLSVSDFSGNAEMEEDKHSIINKVHQLLLPFILRRMKSGNMLNLPPKKEMVIYVPLTRTQLDLYQSTLDGSITKKFNEREEEEVDLYGPRKKRRCTQGRRPIYDLDDSDFEDTDGDTDSDVPENPGTIPSKPKKKMDANVCHTSPQDILLQRELLMYSAVTGVSDKNEKEEEEAQLRGFQKLCPDRMSSSKVTLDGNPEYTTELTPLNMGMQLRKIANHPYLVRMPVANGQLLISEDLITSSGKFIVLKALLPGLKKGGHKVLIFSTFKKVLDLLEALLDMLGFSYCRLDGTSSLEERTENINRFSTSHEDIFAFLISTRAGGLGLNLIAADTVIIFDSDWNPQADLQAQDRCHRIGQTKPVNVYRLVTKATIDEIITKTAEAKRKLEKVVILEGKFSLTAEGANSQLDKEKLGHLLKASLAHCVVDSGDSVLHPNQVERLLKRRHFSELEEPSTHDNSSSEVADLTKLEQSTADGRT